MAVSSTAHHPLNIKPSPCLAVLGLKNGITKSCKNHVAKFRIEHDRIKAAVFANENEISRVDPKLSAELVLLLNDCLHFINEFRKTCDYVLNLASIANRPVDRELKRKFAFSVVILPFCKGRGSRNVMQP
jgi:hypothetical protein